MEMPGNDRASPCQLACAFSGSTSLLSFSLCERLARTDVVGSVEVNGRETLKLVLL